MVCCFFCGYDKARSLLGTAKALLHFSINPDISPDLLLQIARDAYQQYVEEIGKEPAPMVADYAYHCAHDTLITVMCYDTTAGFAIIIEKADGFWLETIAIADGYRGQGIGSALLREVEAYIGSRAASYQLYTNEVMRRNKQWYLSLGFTITDIREAEGFQRIFFEKIL